MAITVVSKQQPRWATNVPDCYLWRTLLLHSENRGMWSCLSKDFKYVDVLELFYKIEWNWTLQLLLIIFFPTVDHILLPVWKRRGKESVIK